MSCMTWARTGGLFCEGFYSSRNFTFSNPKDRDFLRLRRVSGGKVQSVPYNRQAQPAGLRTVNTAQIETAGRELQIRWDTDYAINAAAGNCMNCDAWISG